MNWLAVITCLAAAMTMTAQGTLTSPQATSLQIRVVEGEGAVYAAGSRATRGITVVVTSETGKPVDGATVSFQLPQDGPSGTFTTGAKTEIVTTRADGRAAVWGMPWNRKAGTVEIRITAAKGEARAGTVCAIELSEALAKEAAPAGPSGATRVSGGHKWLWITLAAVGAAGAGVAGVGLVGKSSTSTPSATVTLHIGAPVGVNLGRP